METLIRGYMKRNDALLQSQATSIRNLELQMGQIAIDFSERPQVFLPSNTEMSNQAGDLKKRSVKL